MAKRGRPEKYSAFPRGVNCVYAAQLKNGLVKVGFSRNPRTRMESLRWQVRRQFRSEVIAVFLSDALPDSWPMRVSLAEKAVLRRLAGIGTTVAGTNEFFMHVPFGLAVTLIRQMTRVQQLAA
jgi:hypothetical protein